VESVHRGFAFLKQSWQMAFADLDLIIPSIYALVAGTLMTMIGIIPIIMVFVLWGDRGLGQVMGCLAKLWRRQPLSLRL